MNDIKGRVEGKNMSKNSILNCVPCCKWRMIASLVFKAFKLVCLFAASWD